MTCKNQFDWFGACADEGNDTMINDHLAEKGWPTIPWWNGVKSEQVAYTGWLDGYKYGDTAIVMTYHNQSWAILRGQGALDRFASQAREDRKRHQAEEEAISGSDY